MAVAIRLTRLGHKKAPYYRLIATDSRTKRDGKCLENLGVYQPMTPGGTKIDIAKERIEYWLSVGAVPSETAWSIIKTVGINKPLKKKKKKAASKQPKTEKSAAKTAPKKAKKAAKKAAKKE